MLKVYSFENELPKNFTENEMEKKWLSIKAFIVKAAAIFAPTRLLDLAKRFGMKDLDITDLGTCYFIFK